MPVKLTCPRCNSMLSIPDRLAGQYAFCPKCEGRVWVPQQASASAASVPVGDHASVAPPEQAAASAPPPQPPSAPPTATPVTQKPTATGQTSPPPVATAPPATPSATSPSVAVSAPAATAPPGLDPMAPAPSASPSRSPADGSTAKSSPQTGAPRRASRRVAKFITADVAESKLEVAPDGELPKLQLTEFGERKRKSKRSESATQWRMVLLICGSLAASTFLLFMGPSPVPQSQSSSEQRSRVIIKQKYFGDDAESLETYQRYLREAFLARSRGDRKSERLYYRKVLHLLRAEHHDVDADEKGITGQRFESDASLPSDQELERLLSILLNSQ